MYNLEVLLNIDLLHFLIISSIIFFIGVVGIVINRKTVINILLCVELMLLSVNINMVAFSAYFQELTGQICTIFILTMAAAEVAVGLAIIINYYNSKGSIDITDINELEG